MINVRKRKWNAYHHAEQDAATRTGLRRPPVAVFQVLLLHMSIKKAWIHQMTDNQISWRNANGDENLHRTNAVARLKAWEWNSGYVPIHYRSQVKAVPALKYLENLTQASYRVRHNNIWEDVSGSMANSQWYSAFVFPNNQTLNHTSPHEYKVLK